MEYLLKYSDEEQSRHDRSDHLRITVHTNVVISPQFFAWLCVSKMAAKNLGPDDVVKQMAEHVKSVAEQYEQ